MFYYYSPIYYQDYYEYSYVETNEYGHMYRVVIPTSAINTDNTFNKSVKENGTWITIKAELPPPIYKVNYTNYNQDREFLTYISFQEFITVWTPLTAAEIKKLNLIGDYPERNDEPYPIPSSFEEMFGPIEEMTESEYKIRKFFWDTRINYNIDEDNEDPENLEIIKRKEKIKESYLKESAPDLTYSAFFPRKDGFSFEIDEDLMSEFSEFWDGDFPSDIIADSTEQQQPKKSLLDETEKIDFFDIIDVYRCNESNKEAVNPIENWKKYFNKREIYTIPTGTYVKGSTSISNSKSEVTSIHPRETSYSIEDGARRYYSNDKFITPIIEYQKVIQLNYERLPEKKEESRIYELEEDMQPNQSKRDENGNLMYDENGNVITIETLPPVWMTDKYCQWGDGFSIDVSIPFKKNGEIQSPFSDEKKVTYPPGIYCHDVVKPEDQLRYNIDFYDSLDKVRKFDFPNYVNIIRAFQKQNIP